MKALENREQATRKEDTKEPWLMSTLKKYRCDLHIHSCLSPCADLDMYPRALVARSIETGLNVIGICDHNSAENVRYITAAARGTDLTVFPGMEITSREEVHVLSLFDNIEPLFELQGVVHDALPGMNDEKVFGCQAIVNEQDEVEGFCDRLLIGSTTLPLETIVDSIHRLGGLVIAAHVDRDSFGIIGQLGFIPDTLRLDALEVSRKTSLAGARKQFAELNRYPLITSSDAHRITDIGRVWTELELEKATIAECLMAFKGQSGRRIVEK